MRITFNILQLYLSNLIHSSLYITHLSVEIYHYPKLFCLLTTKKYKEQSIIMNDHLEFFMHYHTMVDISLKP
jgi:hypothetical protein